MDEAALLLLLAEVRAGRLTDAAAVERLAALLSAASADAEGAFQIDHPRALRCGAPEVVLGSSKRPDELVRIALEVLARWPRLLVTRVDAPRAAALAEALPEAVLHERARCVTVDRAPPKDTRPGVLIVCAGPADVPVAEEARVTAAMLGQSPATLYDVAKAGLDGLTSRLDPLREARVVVVAAGAGAALPSVVGGRVGVPVIAVPTSAGDGPRGGGFAALVTMAKACAPNVTFVDVDNGFGAGYVASLVHRPADAAGACPPSPPATGPAGSAGGGTLSRP